MHGFITKLLASALALVLASPFAFGQGGGGGGSGGGGASGGAGAAGAAGMTGAAGGAGMGGRAAGFEQVVGAGPGNGPGASVGVGGTQTAGRTNSTNPARGSGTTTGNGQTTNPGTTGGNGQTTNPATGTGRAGGAPPSATALSGVGGNGLPRNILAPLFREVGVQKKLNLTPDQLGRLGEADVRLRLALKDSLRDTTRLSRGAAAVRSDELLLKYNSDLMHAISRILDAHQMERYRQLSRASEGLFTFTDPDVVKGLKLTDKQQERLRALKEKTDKKMNNLITKAEDDVPAVLAKAGDLRREAMTQVGPILEPDQKKAFAKMTGYHFAPAAKSSRENSDR